MSKKKASTMSLKDFHGGIIPSDLPLPSAPGMSVRSPDDRGYRRQVLVERPEYYRSRPHTSPSMRTYDDRTLFMSFGSHIGRHFDEDERKPLSGVLVRPQTMSDYTRCPSSVSAEVNLGQAGSFPSSGMPSAQVKSNLSRMANNIGVKVQATAGGNMGSYPYAQSASMEAVGINVSMQSDLSKAVISSKLANASALEKIASGKWLSRFSVQQQPDIEVIQHSEMESSPSLQCGNEITNNESVIVQERDSYDAVVSRHASRSMSVGIQRADDGLEVNEMERVLMDSVSTLKDVTASSLENQPFLTNDKVNLVESQHSKISSEVPERPRLRLLPRSKPVKKSDPNVVEYKQIHSESVHAKCVTGSQANVNSMKPGFAGTERIDSTVGRPKLDLKPRSPLLQQSRENVDRESCCKDKLFGGARPREEVLKERAVSDVANDDSLVKSPARIKSSASKTETARASFVAKGPFDHRTQKEIGRKDQRIHIDRSSANMKYSKNDGRRINMEMQKKQLGRQRSPETWRKPEPELLAAPGMRCGKAASAVELAMSFSTSVSDTRQHSYHKGIPHLSQMPFSRLMGPVRRHQINGY